MSLFYDRLMIRGQEAAATWLRAPRQLSRCTVVRADEVYRWWGSQPGGLLQPYVAVTCAPPPFDRVWVEYKSADSDGVVIMGTQVVAASDDTGWVLSFESFGEGLGIAGGIGFLGSAETRVALDGQPVWETFCGRDKDGVWDYRVWNPHAAEILMVLLTFQFMSCPPEHVPRTRVFPDAPLSKRWERKTGRPLKAYYTLNLGPSPEERRIFNRSRNEDAAAHRAPRLHWVRGHFMAGHHVCGEKPQGVWRRPHLRGNASSGVALKNYNVRTPQVDCGWGTRNLPKIDNVTPRS